MHLNVEGLPAPQNRQDFALLPTKGPLAGSLSIFSLTQRLPLFSTAFQLFSTAFRVSASARRLLSRNSRAEGEATVPSKVAGQETRLLF